MNANYPSNPHHILVRCRPGRIGWLLIVICGVCGGLCLRLSFSVQQPPDLGTLIIGCVLLIAMLGFLIYILFSQILTDDKGLYWLGFQGWRSVLWSEVTDYYEEVLPKGTLASFIVTPIHTFMLDEVSWTNVIALRKCVQLRATHARSSDWHEQSARWGNLGK